MIGAALKTGADAIHPGYGFLSEDPYFAEICADHDITFIGPKPEVMEKVGDKAIARRLMRDAGLPLLPGTIEPVATVAGRRRTSRDEIGYPLIIKAVAGGGGRGMNVVRAAEDLERLYKTTRATAQAVFKDSAVYMERYLEAPRHTEVQLVVRQPRQRRLLLRARLLGPAPPPEADRGGAVDPPRRGRAARHRRARRARRVVASATRARARWSSCSTTRATSRSWR